MKQKQYFLEEIEKLERKNRELIEEKTTIVGELFWFFNEFRKLIKENEKLEEFNKELEKEKNNFMEENLQTCKENMNFEIENTKLYGQNLMFNTVVEEKDKLIKTVVEEKDKLIKTLSKQIDKFDDQYFFDERVEIFFVENEQLNKENKKLKETVIKLSPEKKKFLEKNVGTGEIIKKKDELEDKISSKK